MILTDTNTGRFLCVVNTTKDKFVSRLNNYDNVRLLEEMFYPNESIDWHNHYSVECYPITGKYGAYDIDIYGDDGSLHLTLTEYPIEW